VPESFPERDRLFPPDEWINDGNAVVVQPGGALAAGPLRRETGILYAEIDPEAARRARRRSTPAALRAAGTSLR
jgi:nitrilase